MPRFKLSRRAVLRGAGGIAIALPWLEIMTSRRAARAASPAQRLLTVYTPGGTVLDKWRPTGTETAFTLSPILAPLEPVRDRIIVVDGVDMKSAIGEQSESGIIAWLTGTAQKVPESYAGGPSIDQVLAARPAAAGKRLPSLQMAVRWGTGRSHGLTSPMSIANFATTNPFPPIPPRLDPTMIWKALFGDPPAAPSASPSWDRSMLDFVDRRYVALGARLGSADKQRLDEHLTHLRDLEQRVQALPTCAAPALADTSGYNPGAGRGADDAGTVKDVVTDAAIPKVGKLMIDMMVMAMACDLTTVGSLQWADTEAKYTLPWLNLPETHYFYENGGGYRPTELQTIYTWYCTQHAYLLQQMAKVDMGGHSLLDESVVFFGSEVQNPATHLKNDMPFLLAGGGGGLRPGRWVTYDHRSHNDLLVAILNLFGDPRTTFGDAAYSVGPLPNLT